MTTQIDIANIDSNLLSDIDNNTTGWELFEAEYPKASVSNQAYQIVFNDDAGRAGIVLVGSGSSGLTHWTDARSADHAMELFNADEMQN